MNYNTNATYMQYFANTTINTNIDRMLICHMLIMLSALNYYIREWIGTPWGKYLEYFEAMNQKFLSIGDKKKHCISVYILEVVSSFTLDEIKQWPYIFVSPDRSSQKLSPVTEEVCQKEDIKHYNIFMNKFKTILNVFIHGADDFDKDLIDKVRAIGKGMDVLIFHSEECDNDDAENETDDLEL